MPQHGSHVVKGNRTKILPFSILTLILTAATVWAGRVWLRNYERWSLPSATPCRTFLRKMKLLQ